MKGLKVIDFEKKLGECIGVEYVISCNLGIAVLYMVLLVFGVGEGDEVIVLSFMFCFSVNVILYVGVVFVFVDICEKSLCVDFEDVRKKIMLCIKVVIVVYFVGYLVDLENL